jgi:hypothetical protein
MCISKIHFGHLIMSISNITTAQLRILVAIVDETSFSAADSADRYDAIRC